MKRISIAVAVLALSALALPASADHDQNRRQQNRHSKGIKIPGPKKFFKKVGKQFRRAMRSRQIATYETRTVYRQVFVGYDRCGYPIYETRAFCERVPVYRPVYRPHRQPAIVETHHRNRASYRQRRHRHFSD